jgi:type VI secretion system protein ImpL
VVVSASELSGPRDEFLSLAEAIGKQLRSLKASFRKTFPIYLIVNRLDSLNGFTEFFYDLSREERSQTWGFTCNTNDITYVNQQFDHLLSKLNDQLLFRLQQQSQLSQRAKIHDFPMEMANLKPRLLDFMQHALPEKQGLAWHSIYFTSSATKSATEIIGKSLAHLHPAFNESIPQNNLPKAYFVENLLKQFIERQNQQQLISQNKAKNWYRRSIYLLAGLVIAVGASAWAYAFNHQLSAIHHTEQVLAKYQALTQNKQTPKGFAQQIILLDTLKQAATIPPTWFTATQVKKLQTAAQQTYQLALQTLLLPHIIQILGAQLAAPRAAEPTNL